MKKPARLHMTQWFFFSFFWEKILTKKLAKLIKLILEKQKNPKIPQFICQKIAKTISGTKHRYDLAGVF